MLFAIVPATFASMGISNPHCPEESGGHVRIYESERPEDNWALCGCRSEEAYEHA